MLRRRLATEHDVHVISDAEAPGAEHVRRRFDPNTRTLYVPEHLSPGQRAFQIALQLALVEHARLLDSLVADAMELDDAARPLARIGLAQYFAGATLLPYTTFADAASARRYDIDLLAAHFGVGVETICHRLSTLQRTERKGIPFIFVRTDRAGNISKRQSATAFHFSQSGGSCPLWVVHRAFETPNRFLRQLAVMPDGRRYLWVARTVSGLSRGFGQTVPEFSIGLGCAVEHASDTVYATGLDLADHAAGTPIGAGCRVCPRERCAQRAFPYIGAPQTVDHNMQCESPYSITTPHAQV